jgi:hypothetical protein
MIEYIGQLALMEKIMSDKKKKEVKEKKHTKITAEELATARETGVLDFPLLAIRTALKCSWKRAVEIRHELLGRKK